MKYEERKQVTRIKRRLKAWVKPTVSAIMAITLTALLAQNLLPAIEADRGYFAIGGEWFLLIAVLLATYSAVGALLELTNSD